VLLVFVLFLIEESTFDTSLWPAPLFVPACELLKWWNKWHETEGQDTFCHFITEVRNSEVESDDNAGLQFHDWQQTFGNREKFLS